jgi:ATP-dependent RNA helicase RhlE
MERVIIFSRTKHGADRVAKNLEIDGHKAAAIHGNKSQNARERLIRRTLPYTGDLHLANDTGVVEAPRSAYKKPSGGRPGPRSSKNPRAPQADRRSPAERRPFAEFSKDTGGKSQPHHQPSDTPRSRPAEAGRSRPESAPRTRPVEGAAPARGVRRDMETGKPMAHAKPAGDKTKQRWGKTQKDAVRTGGRSNADRQRGRA